MCLYTGSDFNYLRTFIRNYGRKGAKPNKSTSQET